MSFDTSASTRPCAIFDIDGTLAEFGAEVLGPLVHGVEKHWDVFHDAMSTTPEIAPVARILRHLKAGGETIVLRSGRPKGWIERTTEWLQVNNLPYDGIYLRPEGADEMSDPDVKLPFLPECAPTGMNLGSSLTTVFL